MNKFELKQSALRMFNNTHVDNKNTNELLRCVNICNGNYMATTGEQLSKTIVNEAYTELKKGLVL